MRGDPGYDLLFDLDGNRAINVTDILCVVHHHRQIAREAGNPLTKRTGHGIEDALVK